MAELKDVKYWVNSGFSPNSIYHISAYSKNGWSHTLCHTMTTSGSEQLDKPPKRKCRKCMKNLKLATVAR